MNDSVFAALGLLIAGLLILRLKPSEVIRQRLEFDEIEREPGTEKVVDVAARALLREAEGRFRLQRPILVSTDEQLREKFARSGTRLPHDIPRTEGNAPLEIVHGPFGNPELPFFAGRR